MDGEQIYASVILDYFIGRFFILMVTMATSLIQMVLFDSQPLRGRGTSRGFTFAPTSVRCPFGSPYYLFKVPSVTHSLSATRNSRSRNVSRLSPSALRNTCRVILFNHQQPRR